MTSVTKYRPVCCYIWNDDKFPYTSDDCQLVWFHIFTNPLNTPLGLLRASVEGLAAEKNLNRKWSLRRYRNAFEDAMRQGFLLYDENALLIYFPKFFSRKHRPNHPTSLNQVKSWGKIWKGIPESPLKYQCYRDLNRLATAIPMGACNKDAAS